MLRVRLKADGRVVEIRPDGSERAFANGFDWAIAQAALSGGATMTANGRRLAAIYARSVRARTKLTQAEFAARIGVPIETVRNWEQGKRSPRGPARALLRLIDKAPDVAFAVLGDDGLPSATEHAATRAAAGGPTRA
jgi:putative transcriptional regulator